MSEFAAKDTRFYVHQADATKSQDNPASGQKYTLLDTTTFCRIIDFMVRVAWTVQPTPAEIHVTIDGQSLTFTKGDPVNGTLYFFKYWGGEVAGGFLGADNEVLGKAFILEGKSVKIEIETTGGTTSNITGRAKYARYI